MMRQLPATSSLQLLVDALPNAVLRPLILMLLGAKPTASAPAPEPPARKRGWIKGRPRGPRKRTIAAPDKIDRLVDAMAESRSAATIESKRAKRRAKEAQRRQARRTAKNGSSGNGTTAEKLWKHAETLAPGKPWRAIVREFGTNEAAAVDAHRNKRLPPGIVSSAIERFLDLPAT
jgi:hypothetical protein